MKIICKYSGIPFISSPFFPDLQLGSIHPIFEARTEVLFSQRNLIDWNKGILSEEERKLLFLAILNSTGLAIFKRPAEPSKQCVLYNWEELLNVASWITDTAQYLYIHEDLPHFVIDDATYDLATIHGWILAIQGIREDYRVSQRKKKSAAKAMDKTGKLQNLVLNHVNGSKVPRLNSELASWAFDLAGLKDEETTLGKDGKQTSLRSFWASIICCPDTEVFGIEKEDITELVEFCEYNVPTDFSKSSSFDTVRRQLFERLYFLQNFGFSVIDMDSLTPEQREEQEMEEDIKREALRGPEPSAKDFPKGDKDLDYKIAKARWHSLF